MGRRLALCRMAFLDGDEFLMLTHDDADMPTLLRCELGQVHAKIPQWVRSAHLRRLCP